MPLKRLCKTCGRSMLAYNALQNKCYDCTKKSFKPLSQRGKKARDWERFRDLIAKPHLDRKYGHVCNEKDCRRTEELTVDHVLGRGSHPGLRLDPNNMQYLCFEHHRQKTDGVKLQYKHTIRPKPLAS